MAGHVTAYELDRSLHRTVKARVDELYVLLVTTFARGTAHLTLPPPFRCRGLSDKFTLHQGDFLSHDLPPFDMCVANIPFQVCSCCTAV